jgi:hypothetical protein
LKTIHITTDGKRFTDDEAGAESHEGKLERISEFLKWRGTPEGRAQTHERNVILAWMDYHKGSTTPGLGVEPTLVKVAGVDVPEQDIEDEGAQSKRA